MFYCMPSASGGSLRPFMTSASCQALLWVEITVFVLIEHKLKNDFNFNALLVKVVTRYTQGI